MVTHSNHQFSDFAEELMKLRKEHTASLPVKSVAKEFIDELLMLFFPHFSVHKYYDSNEIESKIFLLRRNLKEILTSLNGQINGDNDKIAEEFSNQFPSIHAKLMEDAEAIYKGDPAAESIDEVILAYPGFLAITIYRLAHELYKLNVPILPRIFSEYAHQITGVDINPGAKIGTPFFIDHATGVVIGETSVIGNNVKIYQGVTLGALSVDKKLSKTKRHPTIKDNVVIYSNAVILGGNTVIGENSVIGGNVWLTRSVEPNSVVYHRNEIRLKNESTKNSIDFVI